MAKFSGSGIEDELNNKIVYYKKENSRLYSVEQKHVGLLYYLYSKYPDAYRDVQDNWDSIKNLLG